MANEFKKSALKSKKANLNSKITKLKNARIELNNHKTSFNNHISDWNSAKSSSKKGKLATVVQMPNVFDGTMAKGLKNEYVPFIESLAKEFADVKDIPAAISNQISKIDIEIANCNSAISSIDTELANLDKEEDD